MGKKKQLLLVIKSNGDDALHRPVYLRNKCHSFQKEADVSCGYGGYKESLPLSRDAFVPASAGRHRANIMTLGGKEREKCSFAHPCLSLAGVCLASAGQERKEKGGGHNKYSVLKGV